MVLLLFLKTDTTPVLETVETAAATAVTSPVTAVTTATVVVARTASNPNVSKATLATKMLSLSSVFAIYKPKGPLQLLNQLKEKLSAELGMPSPEWTKRKKQTWLIWHGRTLDSAAQGVPAIRTGKGTKILTSTLSEFKRYVAIGELLTH
ncbi:putative tRNA pseudouridine synthase 1 [Tupaia chinensis]|uniref:Putative tRNA pseudouridine synthase 1 n=1 Tax=Tupaia chinensis TaxID=246437 RepID=L9L1J6_TUPCH|nr:putative tRNA pseudouridine synthase 1 [Tupaia chinensis]